MGVETRSEGRGAEGADRAPSRGRERRAGRRLAAAVVTLLAATAAGADTTELVTEGHPMLSEAGATASLMSADGRYVVVSTGSRAWPPWIVNPYLVGNIYLWDRQTDTFALVSHAAASTTTAANASSSPVAISANGRYVTFDSEATDLVVGSDSSGTNDAFLWDRDTGQVALISHATGSATTSGNDETFASAISADGRYVAIRSAATNLVAGYSGSNEQIYLWDRQTNANILVSHIPGSVTTGCNSLAEPRAVSADGQYVVYGSAATNLISGYQGSGQQVFQWDRVTGTSRLVSHTWFLIGAADAPSSPSGMSADGRFVTFGSAATNLISGYVPGVPNFQAYIWDRTSNVVTLISHTSTSATHGCSIESEPLISAGGGYVVFASRCVDLLPVYCVTGPSLPQTFVWNRATGLTTLASHYSGDTDCRSNNSSFPVATSTDGRYVAFWSDATNLVTGFTGSGRQAYLWDRDTSSTSLVSHVAGEPTDSGDGTSAAPSAVSADGRYVAFGSRSSDLVPGIHDTNARADAFLWDRVSDSTTMVSHPLGDVVEGANGPSWVGGLSANGHYVAFSSYAMDLLPEGERDENFLRDAFLWHRNTGEVWLASHAAGSPTTAANASSVARALSADGRFLAIWSEATDLVAGYAGSGAQAFLWDRDTGSSILVSRAAGTTTTAGSGLSEPLAVSAEGRYVTLHSWATNLVPGYSGSGQQVFLWDRDTAVMALVSHAEGSATTGSNASATVRRTSDDGRFVLYDSTATDLVAGYSGSGQQAYLWDRDSSSTTLVSHAVGSATSGASSAASAREMSADGRFVAFNSAATDLVAGYTGSANQVFLWDCEAGASVLVSHASGSATTAGNAAAAVDGMSPDGRFVAFHSEAADLVAGYTGSAQQAFLWDRTTDTVVLLSHATGSPTAGADGASTPRGVGADGRFVTFTSFASDLVAGYSGSDEQLYRWDRDTGTVTLVSHAAGSATSGGNADTSNGLPMGVSGYVLFSTAATDLVAAGTNGVDQIYLWSEAAVDTTPPVGPTVDSTSPAVGTWSNDATVEVTFSGAFDPPDGSGVPGLGVAGYSLLFDASPGTEPDDVVDLPQGSDPHVATSAPLADGGTWYFHLATCDLAGNCTSGVHAGPFWIDATPPEPPSSATSPSHDGGPSQDATIDVEWASAVDGLSGVGGYAWTFSTASSWTCDEVEDGGASTTSATSTSVAEGDWYFHLCARDLAHNWSGVGSFGPWTVDQTAPQVDAVDSVPEAGIHGGGTPEVGAAVTELLVAFDEAMAESGAGSVTDSDNWQLVEAGPDGMLETSDCGPLAGDDAAGPWTSIAYDAGSFLASVAVGGGSGLGTGSYRLLACSTLTDAAGNALDGGLGSPSTASWSTDFGVVVDPLAENPNFDADEGSWVLSGPQPADFEWQPVDAESKPSSGSLRVDTVSGIGVWRVEQCLDLGAPGDHRLRALARIAGGAAGEPTVHGRVVWFDGPTCTGSILGGTTGPDRTGETGGAWVAFEVSAALPPAGALSAWAQLEISAAATSTYTVELDRVFFGKLPDLLSDGFETGDVCRWGRATGGPVCP